MRYCIGLMLVCSAFGQGGFNGPGSYEITNIKSGKVLDLDRNDQTTVIQNSSRGTDNQTWYIQQAGSGAWYIRNGMNGNALTATQNRNSAPLQGLPYNGDPSQQWGIEAGKDGNAMIVSRGNKALDIPDGSDRDGVRVQIYDSNGDSNQRFALRQVSRNSNGRNRPAWMGGGQGQNAVITCSSDDGRRNYCNADTRGGVQMTRQISGSPCIQGQTWGQDSRGLWVDRGCRAEFQVGQSQVNPGYNRNSGAYGDQPRSDDRRNTNNNNNRYNNNSNSSVQTVTCNSDDGKRHYCDVDTRNGVNMTRKISGSPCVQGESWGYDNRGVWVDRGCRAEFQTGGGR